MIITLVSGLAAIIAAFVAAYSHQKVVKINNEIQQEMHKAQYREPFLRAIYDLQGRIYNILNNNYLDKNVSKEQSARAQQYAINNTAYLIAQVFGWNELIRNELFYLDTNNDELTKRLADAIDSLYSEWRLDDFEIFPGEQRAIGEIMVEEKKCIGYSTFLKRYSNKEEDIINVLYEFIDYISNNTSEVKKLDTLHSRLIDILDIMDPKKIKFPKYRDRIKQ